MYFYPRPPRGGRQSAVAALHLGDGISIHALREEGDSTAGSCPARWSDFYPRPPRGGRRIRNHITGFFWQFLSTPSARRATYTACVWLCQFDISIHALREEGDTTDTAFIEVDYLFLSTPSARRATAASGRFPRPAPNFYPRPLRGGRLFITATMRTGTVFLSTPSARRATPEESRRRHPLCISIHALREEGDAFTTSVSVTVKDFYPRPPRGGRRWLSTRHC